MIYNTLFRLLGAAYGLMHVLARWGIWIFGAYGVLTFGAALIAGQAVDSIGTYSPPLLIAVGIFILDRLFAAAMHRLAGIPRLH